MNRRVRCLFATIIVALYLASMLVPALYITTSSGFLITEPGHVAFSVTLAGISDWEFTDINWWILTGAWFVNPALWVATVCFLCGYYRVAFVVAGCGCGWALAVVLLCGRAVGNYPGYWMWFGSIALLFTLSGVAALRSRRNAARASQSTAEA